VASALHPGSKTRKLKLQRPLAFVDIETTGLNPLSDRIVEIAVVKMLPDGKTGQFHSRINPEMRIPAEASFVHGITNTDVQDKPIFKSVATRLAKMLSGCDLSGFNVSTFDIQCLQEEFRRARVEFSINDRHVVDVQRIYHLKEPRDLAAAYRFYCQSDHMRAHSALDDALVSLKVLLSQVQRYSDLPNSVEGLARFCIRRSRGRFLDSERWFEGRDGKPHFARGKHRGRPLDEVAKYEPDYLVWILEQGVATDTARIIRRVLRPLV